MAIQNVTAKLTMIMARSADTLCHLEYLKVGQNQQQPFVTILVRLEF